MYQNELKSDLNFGVGGHVISPEIPPPRRDATEDRWSIRKIRNKTRLIIPPSAVSEQYRLVKSSREELLRAQMKVKKGKMRDLPRAVGLWLWDQKTASSQSVRSSKEIFEDFRSTFKDLLFREDDAEFNKAYLDDDDHLYRLLNRTIKYIEKVEVESMK